MSSKATSIFRQTLYVLVGGLLVTHLVVFLAVAMLPPSSSLAIGIEEVAQELARPGCRASPEANARLSQLIVRRQSQPPAIGPEMTRDKLLTAQLANALALPPESVRIFWTKGSEIRINDLISVNVDGRQSKLGQTIFMGGTVFAREDNGQWCVHSMPTPRLVVGWQWRTAMIVALSLLALLPMAWLFARRLSRPIRDFGLAANRIGYDRDAPPIEEAGPKEVRSATRAVNDMQRRIQQQITERDAMIAGIAHDLRTPLSRIAFRVEAAPEAVRNAVQRDIEQLKDLIASTLEFARYQNGNRVHEPLDIGILLNEMVEAERAIGHTPTLSIDTPDCTMRGNPTDLRRLFQNLIDNAQKYGAPPEITVTADDNWICVTVADRGPGIAPEKIDEMFMSFTRGEPSRNRETGGVGLGLAIVKAIAEQHGGEAHLRPREGGGMIAVVRLPQDRD